MNRIQNDRREPGETWAHYIKRNIGNGIGSTYGIGAHRLVAETIFRIGTDETFSSTTVYSNTIDLTVKGNFLWW